MSSVSVLPQTAVIVSPEDFMPIFSPQQAVERKKQLNQIIAGALEEGVDRDYSALPGAGARKILLKPGAEKLTTIFGLNPTYHAECEIEDWTGNEHNGEPLFYYKYKCMLWRGPRLLGEAIGSCNSWETKYRYRWVTEEHVPGGDITGLLVKSGSAVELDFAISKAETSGKYGKPAEYWQKWVAAIESGEATETKKKTSTGKEMKAWEMGSSLYRISNPEFADIVNTCQKMAQKRALVAAVLVATNASDSFTQDMEDFIPLESEPSRGSQDLADQVAEKRIETLRASRSCDNDPLELKEMLHAVRTVALGAVEEVLGYCGGQLETLAGPKAYQWYEAEFVKWDKARKGKKRIPQDAIDFVLQVLWPKVLEYRTLKATSDSEGQGV